MKIAQCWDDGVNDDIRLIEILRRRCARASFNLNAALHGKEPQGWWSDHYKKSIAKIPLGELVQVYDGFLVANHTATHPHLTKISREDALREICEGRDALEQIFGYEIKGFAYPFGDYNESVEELVREAGHVYARTAQDVAQPFPVENPMALHPNCHFLAKDFWSRFEAVRKEDGVFYFWGHSYEINSEAEWQAFEDQIIRLGAAGEWVNLPDLFPQG